MKTIKVGLAQVTSKQGKVEENLNIIEEHLQNNEAQIVVFPELSTTGYLIHDKLFSLAESIPNGPITHQLSNLSKKYDKIIITGIPELSRPSVIYNSAIVVEPTGQINTTRKILLPNHSVFNEKRYFRPAQEMKAIKLDSLDLTIGLQICYDLWAPEISRALAFQGASIIFVISASPGMRQEYFETFIKARALENNAFLVYVNQAGIQDHLSFWGGSRVVSPRGESLIQLSYDKPDFGVIEIDLEKCSQAATFIPTLRDTRPYWYQELEKYSKTI